MNYERDMQIDESSLDVEWLEQPSLVMKYARNESETERLKDLAKENLDLVKAKLDRDIRVNPENFDLKDVKITEPVVTNAVINHANFKDANKKYIDAVFEWNLAKNAMKAVIQRKDALENLVRLLGLNYFAGPKIPRDIAQVRMDRNVSTQINNKKVKRLRKKL